MGRGEARNRLPRRPGSHHLETEEALLVCHKDRAQDVRQVVDQLKARRLEKTL
ncbi:MAG: hypothetical protein HY039_01395 [Nitrospirae bacterium]|nr:hypothetical protein [Nitrospirota bacterium]